MAKTRRIQRRMNQRGIKSSFLDIVRMFGFESCDKTILNKKACGDLLTHLDALRKDIIYMHEKAALFLSKTAEQILLPIALILIKNKRHLCQH